MANWDKIRKEFETTDISMKALADKYNVKYSTLRSRKSREKWGEDDATQRDKNVATPKKNVATQQHREEALKKIDENKDLTEKQKLFCQYYAQSFNATQSYIKAYDVDYDTAKVNGNRMLTNANIPKEIKRIKEARRNDWLFDDDDLIEPWMKQAFADITDYVEFGTEEVTEFDADDMPVFTEDGEVATRKTSFVRFKDQDKLDGTIIQEVKLGRDGPVIKLYDKQTALKELTKLFGEKELKRELLKAQIKKAQADAKEAERVANEEDDALSTNTYFVDEWGMFDDE